MKFLNKTKNEKPELPPQEVLTAIENIKSALNIQKQNGNQNAEFVLKRLR